MYVFVSFRKVREELKEYKKKKAQKKLTRLQEISEFREHEKQRWKSFTQKVGLSLHNHGFVYNWNTYFPRC